MSVRRGSILKALGGSSSLLASPTSSEGRGGTKPAWKVILKEIIVKAVVLSSELEFNVIGTPIPVDTLKEIATAKVDARDPEILETINSSGLEALLDTLKDDTMDGVRLIKSKEDNVEAVVPSSTKGKSGSIEVKPLAADIATELYNIARNFEEDWQVLENMFRYSKSIDAKEVLEKKREDMIGALEELQQRLKREVPEKGDKGSEESKSSFASLIPYGDDFLPEDKREKLIVKAFVKQLIIMTTMQLIEKKITSKSMREIASVVLGEVREEGGVLDVLVRGTYSENIEKFANRSSAAFKTGGILSKLSMKKVDKEDEKQLQIAQAEQLYNLVGEVSQHIEELNKLTIVVSSSRKSVASKVSTPIMEMNVLLLEKVAKNRAKFSKHIRRLSMTT